MEPTQEQTPDLMPEPTPVVPPEQSMSAMERSYETVEEKPKVNKLATYILVLLAVIAVGFVTVAIIISNS